MNQKPYISIILPVYNEEGNLPVLLRELREVMEPLDRQYEIVCVDDASRDKSLEIIRKTADTMPEIRYLAFKQNRGQSAAFTAGFDFARAEIIVTMDSDLQNNPVDIPKMLGLFEQGHDMVIGFRAKRQDSNVKKVASKVGNWVRNKFTGEDVRDTGCSLKVMKTDMARKMPRFNGMHRFFTTLMRMQGASITQIEVSHRPRIHGESKYGTWDRLKATVYDLFGVRWLISRAIPYEISEKSDK